jgi:sugar lactone lactonase YvrE
MVGDPAGEGLVPSMAPIVELSLRSVYDFSPGRGAEGLEVDVKGVLHVCAAINRPRTSKETADTRAGVYRIPGGALLDVLPVSTDIISNCCLGGPDMRTLFVTAGHRLHRTRVADPGWHAWRWA